MRRGAAWLMIGGGWALACGGRYEQNPRESDTESVAGSSASVAGGATPAGGAAGGGTGGVVSSGGAGAVSGSRGPTVAACAEQAEQYRDYWSEVMSELDSFPCAVDEDCRAYHFRSPCDGTCTLLKSAAHRGIADRLTTYGGLNCNSSCWPQPVTNCPSVPPVHCVATRCE